MKHLFLLSDNKRSVKKNPARGQIRALENSSPLDPNRLEVNTTEGGEILDDGIRKNEEPLGSTGIDFGLPCNEPA